jgi:branched-chain amino acid transport system permease protein
MKFNIDCNSIIKHKSFKWISVVLIACFMAFAPKLLSTSQLRIATMILFSIGLSSSYNLIGGMVGYPSFGHVVFIGTGAYTAAVLVNTYHIPFLISVFVAGITATFFSLVLGAPILRLRGHYFAVVTFAVQMAVAEFVSSIDFLGGGVGLVFKTVYSYKSYYYMFLVASGLTVLCTYFVRRSRLGYGFLAINRNEIRAETLGIPTTSYKMVAFALSAFWPGILGAIFGNYIGFIDTHIAFDPKLSISMVLFCLAGGIGTIMGPVIGAVIISFFNEVLWANLPNFHLMIYGFVLVVFILFFPSGILGFLRGRRSNQSFFNLGYWRKSESS